MQYTPNSPTATNPTSTPTAAKKPPSKRGWLARVVAALPKLPQTAATMLDDGYRFAPDPKTPARILVFKPNAAPGADAAYHVDIWKDRMECRFRYRCTCPFYTGMVKNCELEPECKHGIAAVAEYKRLRAQYDEALAWVQHVEGVVPVVQRGARAERTPDYLDRLASTNHFGLPPQTEGHWAHVDDIVWDTRTGKAGGYEA